MLGADLTSRERRRLFAVVSDRGLDVTRTLHKSFRLGKLLSTLPLICTALGEERLASEVSRFWRARLPRSFYFLEEALAFCTYLVERRREGLSVPYLEEVLAYERATLELRLASLAGESPAPQRVNFYHDPEALLSKLASGTDLSDIAQGFFPLCGTLSPSGAIEWRLLEVPPSE